MGSIPVGGAKGSRKAAFFDKNQPAIDFRFKQLMFDYITKTMYNRGENYNGGKTLCFMII